VDVLVCDSAVVGSKDLENKTWWPEGGEEGQVFTFFEKKKFILWVNCSLIFFPFLL
jgi:hypothetical protein